LDDVQHAVRSYATPSRFGDLARRFFADYISRTLRFFVEKELSNIVGSGLAVKSVDDSTRFTEALDVYSRQSARIIRDFARDWYDYAWSDVVPLPGEPEIDPEIIDDPVKPGDLIQAEVRYEGNGKFVLELRNLTEPRNWNSTRSVQDSDNPADRANADWMVEAPPYRCNNAPCPLSDFGTFRFSDASADDQPIPSGPNTQRYVMTTADGSLPRAEPSELMANGTAFRITWIRPGPN
jgi:hypothetical protein